jgi:hypothetical protein
VGGCGGWGGGQGCWECSRRGCSQRSMRLAARSHELQVSFGCKGWREEFGQGGMEGGIGRLGWGRGGIIVVMERGG